MITVRQAIEKLSEMDPDSILVTSASSLEIRGSLVPVKTISTYKGKLIPRKFIDISSDKEKEAKVVNISYKEDKEDINFVKFI